MITVTIKSDKQGEGKSLLAQALVKALGKDEFFKFKTLVIIDRTEPGDRQVRFPRSAVRIVVKEVR